MPSALAVLLVMVTLYRFVVPVLEMPPPSKFALLPLMVLLTRVSVPPPLEIPPPDDEVAVLPLIVLFIIVVAPPATSMPWPALSSIRLLMRVNVDVCPMNMPLPFVLFLTRL
jgi:hypothetical protein